MPSALRERQAKDKAKNEARERCRRSASFCRASARSPTATITGCAEVVTPGYFRWQRRAQATTTCTYAWPSPW